MCNIEKVLTGSERAVYALRALYKSYGYAQYKMSKFEEYDLYVSNKDYLISDAVITFTDTDGKLLALKPDVTLSIIKNGKDNPLDVKKVCYGENVYRPSKGTRSFKEIMQVGLECQGDIDDYIKTEVVMLAVKSLKSISDEYALDISHLGIVSAVIDQLKLSSTTNNKILEYLGEKNVQAISNLLSEQGVSASQRELLLHIAGIYGSAESVVERLKKVELPEKAKAYLIQLEQLIINLKNLGLVDGVNIDFSVVNDMKYYNGIVFKGFIAGVPTGILSGGQYDNLMQKMGKKSGAIGFAVYLDELENLSDGNEKYDADVVVLYDDNTDIKKVVSEVQKIIKGGESVFTTKNSPDKLRYKRLIKV